MTEHPLGAFLRKLGSPHDFCLWHKADMLNALTSVRFWGQRGHDPTAVYQSRFMCTTNCLALNEVMSRNIIDRLRHKEKDISFGTCLEPKKR
jgi:hypothetical protein